MLNLQCTMLNVQCTMLPTGFYLDVSGLPTNHPRQKKKKGKTIKEKRVTLMALSWQAGNRCRSTSYQDRSR